MPYVPAGHEWTLPPGQYHPLAHGTHCKALVAPDINVYVPAGQPKQVDELCDGAYVPAGQLVHVLAACSLYVPGKHCVHAVGAGACEYVPAEQ